MIRILLVLTLLGGGFILQEAPGKKAPSTPSVDEILKEVSGAYEKIERMAMPFTQEKHVAILKKPIISSGHLLWNRHRLLYRVSDPALNETLITPEEIRVWIPETEKIELFDRTRFRILETIDLGAGRNVDKLKEHYDIKLLKEKEDSPESPRRLELSPKDEKIRNYLTELRLQINRKSPLIERIETTDAAGDRTVILLDVEKMKRNDDVEDTLPALSAPEGTPVIRPLDPGADS